MAKRAPTWMGGRAPSNSVPLRREAAGRVANDYQGVRVDGEISDELGWDHLGVWSLARRGGQW